MEACDDCRRLAFRPLPEVLLQASCDSRVATLTVQFVRRIVERLLEAPTAATSDSSNQPQEQLQHAKFCRRSDRLTAVFGVEDACTPLHEGSRCWAVLCSAAHHLQRACGVQVRIRVQRAAAELEQAAHDNVHGDNHSSAALRDGSSSQEAQQEVASIEPQPSEQAPASSSHQSLNASTGSSTQVGHGQDSACCIHSLHLTWNTHQGAALAYACAGLLASWYPSHAAAGTGGMPHRLAIHSGNSLSNLRTVTAAAAAAASLNGIILGTQERQLASWLLQQAIDGSNELLAALPLMLPPRWQPHGQSEFQGSAVLTLTNGSGIFLCVCVRSVALVRSGNKAKALSLTWPGRFGAAAKAALKGPPGQAEDQAIHRRRQKRYAVAQQAVRLAAQLQASLPEGALVFAATCTSAAEGLQVASAKSRDKPRTAAVLHLLLGLQASWPPPDELSGAAAVRRCRKCGQPLDSDSKASGKRGGRARRHRCHPAALAAASEQARRERAWDASWLSAGWWWPGSAREGGQAEPVSALPSTALVVATAAALGLGCYLLLAPRTRIQSSS